MTPHQVHDSSPRSLRESESEPEREARPVGGDPVTAVFPIAVGLAGLLLPDWWPVRFATGVVLIASLWLILRRQR